ncbi:MAG: hypothetical protein EZS28_045594, partial [Streblomastix strix]
GWNNNGCDDEGILCNDSTDSGCDLSETGNLANSGFYCWDQWSVFESKTLRSNGNLDILSSRELLVSMGSTKIAQGGRGDNQLCE